MFQRNNIPDRLLQISEENIFFIGKIKKSKEWQIHFFEDLFRSRFRNETFNIGTQISVLDWKWTSTAELTLAFVV